MRTSLFTICLLLLIVPCLSRAAERQPQAESFATFWMKFKSAVAKNDKEAVAAATKLPFMNQLTKAAFLKQYPSLFTKAVRKMHCDCQTGQGGGA